MLPHVKTRESHRARTIRAHRVGPAHTRFFPPRPDADSLSVWRALDRSLVRTRKRAAGCRVSRAPHTHGTADTKFKSYVALRRTRRRDYFQYRRRTFSIYRSTSTTRSRTSLGRPVVVVRPSVRSSVGRSVSQSVGRSVSMYVRTYVRPSVSGVDRFFLSCVAAGSRTKDPLVSVALSDPRSIELALARARYHRRVLSPPAYLRCALRAR